MGKCSSYYNHKSMKLEQLRKTASDMCDLAPGLPIVVGVSGGPDSYCLLDALVQLGYPVTAAHFDHQLRPESAQDAEHVRSTASRLGAAFVLGRGDVAAFARQEHRSIEDAARILRYRFLFSQARALSAQAVAVGHTADDQVETLLMHLLRGAGLNGLKGMAFRALRPAWDASIPLVRPLLELWREETLAWCSERGLEPLFDPTNQDPAYLRNRVRHELIPLLEQLNPRARQSLWRASQVLAGEEAILQEAVAAAWDACLGEQQPAALALRRSAFTQLSSGLQRAVLRKAIAQLNPQLEDVDFAAVERARALALRCRLRGGGVHPIGRCHPTRRPVGARVPPPWAWQRSGHRAPSCARRRPGRSAGRPCLHGRRRSRPSAPAARSAPAVPVRSGNPHCVQLVGIEHAPAPQAWRPTRNPARR